MYKRNVGKFVAIGLALATAAAVPVGASAAPWGYHGGGYYHGGYYRGGPCCYRGGGYWYGGRWIAGAVVGGLVAGAVIAAPGVLLRAARGRVCPGYGGLWSAPAGTDGCAGSVPDALCRSCSIIDQRLIHLSSPKKPGHAGLFLCTAVCAPVLSGR
jgi:hypothetical protein